MRKMMTLMAVVCVSGAMAQTLNVKVGSVTYQFPAAEIVNDGKMLFADGSTLTIMGKTFTLSEVSSMYVDNTSVTDDAIAVNYDGATASVTVAGNIAKYVEPQVSGAHVSIAQNDDLAQEITYTLSGNSTDGEFYMSGSYKATVELNGLTLTNVTPVYSGAAVHIQNGKRIKVKPLTGTTSTLTDAASGAQKGCLYVKGHAEFAQKGTLNVYGNVAHGIKAGEYISIKNSTINVKTAVKDGVNCNEYFLMESGTLNIEGVGDDGLQCELDGTESTGELTDHEDEDSGNIYIEDGTITVNSDAVASKGIKCTGDLRIEGGTITVNTTGDGINSASNMEINGGTITVVAKNNDAIDSNGNLTINGGTVIACGAGGAECGLDAYESCKLWIKGGTVLAIGGSNNAVTSTTGSQAVVSVSSSVSAGATVAVKSGTNTLVSFTVPSNYSGNSGGGPGFAPGGGGPGGGGGSNILISSPALTSGTSYTVTAGSNSSSATASTSTSGGGGGGGWW